MTLPRSIPLACALGIAVAGCASVPPPTNQVAVAREAVARAEGTPEVVALAPVEVERARSKAAAAVNAMSARDYDNARRLADEAEADAHAAEARSLSVKNERALAEVRRALAGLREELARRG
jgi:hypothetical protein